MKDKKINIILSGMAGSGKSTLARELAKHYNLTYLCGGDALKGLAFKKGYKFSGDDWWETEEGMKFLEERKKNPDFDKEIDRYLLEKTEEGGYVITSWALPWLKAKGIMVWLNAGQKTRAERIVRRDDIPLEKALEAVKKRDEENITLFRNMYGYTLGKDLEVFDLVLDTDEKTIEELKNRIINYIDNFNA